MPGGRSSGICAAAAACETHRLIVWRADLGGVTRSRRRTPATVVGREQVEVRGQEREALLAPQRVDQRELERTGRGARGRRCFEREVERVEGGVEALGRQREVQRRRHLRRRRVVGAAVGHGERERDACGREHDVVAGARGDDGLIEVPGEVAVVARERREIARLKGRRGDAHLVGLDLGPAGGGTLVPAARAEEQCRRGRENDFGRFHASPS